MKKLSILLIYPFVALGLSGCGEKPEPVQTVDWYKEHNEERMAMVKKCENNLGELAKTPNCINATKAANALIWSSRKAIPLDASEVMAEIEARRGTPQQKK